MSWMVIFTQVFLPLALLTWMTFYPVAGWLAWSLQMIAVAAFLLGIALAALWTMPPFWTPYLYGAWWALAVVIHLVHKGGPGPGRWRVSVAGSVLLVAVAVLGAVGGYLAWHALQGRARPDGALVDIAPPFPPGHYLIAHGGSTPMVNVHLKTLDPTVDRFRPWRGQSKALDIFRITPLGFHKHGWRPTDPAQYTTFGVPVLAPCRGEVARVVDGLEDQRVPEMDRDTMAGNHVAIDCGGFFVFLAHLKQGSVAVTPGDAVETGDLLGAMGNSGNSSEPHLHLHAQITLPEDAALAGEPVWLTINGRFPVRNDRLRPVR